MSIETIITVKEWYKITELSPESERSYHLLLLDSAFESFDGIRNSVIMLDDTADEEDVKDLLAVAIILKKSYWAWKNSRKKKSRFLKEDFKYKKELIKLEENLADLPKTNQQVLLEIAAHKIVKANATKPIQSILQGKKFALKGDNNTEKPIKMPNIKGGALNVANDVKAQAQAIVEEFVTKMLNYDPNDVDSHELDLLVKFALSIVLQAIIDGLVGAIPFAGGVYQGAKVTLNVVNIVSAIDAQKKIKRNNRLINEEGGMKEAFLGFKKMVDEEIKTLGKELGKNTVALAGVVAGNITVIVGGTAIAAAVGIAAGLADVFMKLYERLELQRYIIKANKMCTEIAKYSFDTIFNDCPFLGLYIIAVANSVQILQIVMTDTVRLRDFFLKNVNQNEIEEVSRIFAKTKDKAILSFNKSPVCVIAW